MSLPETTPPRIWLEPMLLPSCVSYRADLGPIFDARDARTLGHYGLSAATLADPGWRSTMLDGRPAPTQDFARTLVADGFAGLLTRSFARGASASSLNLVLWRWAGDGCSLQVVDDEGRLGRM